MLVILKVFVYSFFQSRRCRQVILNNRAVRVSLMLQLKLLEPADKNTYLFLQSFFLILNSSNRYGFARDRYDFLVVCVVAFHSLSK